MTDVGAQVPKRIHTVRFVFDVMFASQILLARLDKVLLFNVAKCIAQAKRWVCRSFSRIGRWHKYARIYLFCNNSLARNLLPLKPRPLPDERPRQSVASLIGKFEQQVKRSSVRSPPNNPRVSSVASEYARERERDAQLHMHEQVLKSAVDSHMDRAPLADFHTSKRGSQCTRQHSSPRRNHASKYS